MWSARLLLALSLTAVTTGSSHAQQQADQTFAFQWTSITNVGLWPPDRTAVPPRPPDRVLRGSGTLTLRAATAPFAFDFDFRGPEGNGSGLVLADRRTLDPNFAFPTAPVAEPPAGQVRRVLSSVRLLGPAARPTLIEVHFIEVFVCRGLPESCGGIRHFERVFTGIGRPAPGG